MFKYKCAIDLGTTNIELALIKSDTGEIIANHNQRNSQSLYGKDIINRILATERNPVNLRRLYELAVDDISSGIEWLLQEVSSTPEQIEAICITGNTTMISILLSYDISGMGYFPFEHKLKSSVTISSHELFGESFVCECPVYLSGCASAFIGGDILSGVIYAMKEKDGFLDNEENSFFIDLGTNAEMILKSNDVYYATSAACGPAFENSICKQNTYGTTLLDVIALSLKNNNISAEGTLSSRYLQKGLTVDGVHLDMDIIRSVLVAKAAIYTSINLMCKAAGISAKNIDKIYVSGGFGMNLNLESAMSIGLFPSSFKHKTTILGNTSLYGAMTLLMDKNALEIMDSFTDEKKINVLQLVNSDEYGEEFVNNMVFKEM